MADDRPAVTNPEMMRRIIRATQAVERTPRNTSPPARGRYLGGDDSGFWAKTYDCDSTTGAVSWNEIRWTDPATNETYDAGRFGTKDSSGGDEDLGPAYDVNGGLAIPIGVVVWLRRTYYHSPATGAAYSHWTFSMPDWSWLALITGSATLGSTGARWKYAWSEAAFTGDAIGTIAGGRSGTTSDGYALNLNEATITVAKSGTTAWYVDGVQANSTTASSAYPTGHAPRPIGGGGTSGTHKLNALVKMSYTLDTSGTYRAVFAAKMNHDGTCS